MRWQGADWTEAVSPYVCSYRAHCCSPLLLTTSLRGTKNGYAQQRGALSAKRRRLDEASFTVYVDLSVTLSYARRPWQPTPSALRMAINYSARRSRPQLDYQLTAERPLMSHEVGRGSGRILMTNRPQIRSIAAAPGRQKWLPSGPQKACFLAATAAADLFHQTITTSRQFTDSVSAHHHFDTDNRQSDLTLTLTLTPCKPLAAKPASIRHNWYAFRVKHASENAIKLAPNVPNAQSKCA